MPSEPHWERGKRVYGYWNGIVRLGWVGLPQGKVTDYGYGLDYPPIEGRSATLRAAKKMVETLYREQEALSHVQRNFNPEENEQCE